MSKKMYDLSIEELKKKASKYKSIFYAYVIFAIVISVITGMLTLQSMDGLNKNQEALGTTNYFLILNTVLISVVFFLLIFLWFISESSYYKMLEQFSDLMIYLKQKEK
jgi:heme/copper-type cytochrome/quinol oxidase subunit 2